MAVADYDFTPYPQYAHQHTHPRVLAAMGRLLGMAQVPAIERCRVLELGCATGANLISMAQDLPDAEFIGIDFSEEQIRQGNDIVAALGLTNVSLRVCSIHDVDEDFGKFDFIVAQGIYSWVPDEIKDRTLQICSANLAEQGIAYVSHNTYPMWHMTTIVRDMMKFHAGHWQDPAEQLGQAKAFLGLMAQSLPQQDSFYGDAVRYEYAKMHGEDDAYISHDILEDVNDPVYLRDFAGHAQQFGLQFLGDAASLKGRLDRLPPAIAQQISELAADVVEHEQYLDFFNARRFRRTLLCHQQHKLTRTVEPAACDGLYVTALATAVDEQGRLTAMQTNRYRNDDGVIAAFQHPVAVTAMDILARQAPGAVLFRELLDDIHTRLKSGQSAQIPQTGLNRARIAAFLSDWLLELYVNNFVSLAIAPPRCVLQLSQYPEASPLARHQAAYTTVVINLKHANIVLNEFRAKLLSLLDGSRDEAELIHSMQAFTDSAVHLQHEQPMAVRIEAALQSFVKNGLLWA